MAGPRRVVNKDGAVGALKATILWFSDREMGFTTRCFFGGLPLIRYKFKVLGSYFSS